MDGLIYPEIYKQAEIDLLQDLEDAVDGSLSAQGDKNNQKNKSDIYNLNEILDSLNLGDEND